MSIGESVSTLASLLVAVRDSFAAAGLDTEIKVGERYVDEESNGNRIVFVPQDGDPTMAPIRAGMGEIASIDMGCLAYVFGVQEGDDFERYDAADEILANLIAALEIRAPGRVTLRSLTRTRETSVDTYGEEYLLNFSFRFAIRATTTMIELTQNARIQPTSNIKEG